MNKKLLIALAAAALFVSSNAQPEEANENGEGNVPSLENGEGTEGGEVTTPENNEGINEEAGPTEEAAPAEEAVAEEATPNEEAAPTEEAAPAEEATPNEEGNPDDTEEGNGGTVSPGFLGGKLLATSAGALLAVAALFVM